VLTVEVEEGRDRLAARLGERGLRILPERADGDARAIRIALDGGAPYDAIRDDVADLDLPLVRIQRARHSLEDLFRVPDPSDEGGVAPAPGPSAPGPTEAGR
jgi:ABC-2 type transport system ATP-binding protein